MMRPGSKRGTKTKSSKLFCKEKYCCPAVDTEASYFCEDCNSEQCTDCDKAIHDQVKYRNHIRQVLKPQKDSILCKSAYIDIPCSDVNFSDVWCEDCQIGLCFVCYERVHNLAKKKKNHHKISFAEHEKRLLALASQEAFRNTAFKPFSPIGEYDDSLTYVSCPQNLSLNLDEEMSFSSFHSDNSQHSIPDLCQNADELISRELEASAIDDHNKYQKGFLLIDDNERILVEDKREFILKLECEENVAVKVVSIFGNTGDGKSYTLNQTFFKGAEVFKTSSQQDACTIGIWASYDPENKAIIIDTEGFLGQTANENQRTRLLLKVLAVSDVVIYRTRAERLTSDMFNFLSDASKAYLKHFAQELTQAMEKIKMSSSISSLGPAITVFHETQHTAPLGIGGSDKDADLALRDKFVKANCKIDAFSDLRYSGTQTVKQPTDFSHLLHVVKKQLGNNAIRAPRRPEIVFTALKILNDKFSGKIDSPLPNTFPDQYFTCPEKCQACGARCCQSMNHSSDSPHKTEDKVKCQLNHQFQNKVFLCKICYNKTGREVIVVPKTCSSQDSSWVGFSKYIWSGYVLECPNCGIIYRSRQYWYGNLDEEAVVRTDVRHVWPEGPSTLSGTHNAGRKVLESLHYVAKTLSDVSAKPTKFISEWTADQIAPSYWVPNSQIINCSGCEMLFTSNDQKHHCRICGKGFCDDCSSKRKVVPEKGWHEAVRVCNACYSEEELKPEDVKNTARKVGEAFVTTIGVVKSAMGIPADFVKNSARPAYWIPDEDIKECWVCKKEFGPKLTVHHCRACGQGVCEECSPERCPVPLRGWDSHVRVCTKCFKKKDKL